MTIYIVMALGILYAVTRLLYLPPDEFGTPLQPVLTFVLAALWISYILYSLHTLIAVDVAPDRIAKFSILVISGAIALSIYFLLPVDWLLSSANRALALLMGERDPGVAARQHSELNSTIAWLQSTAIPSMVAIGFGFLTAYVTSFVWYEFYRTVNGTGLDAVKAARGGRDPTRNKYWFDLLKASKYRVTLVGATLGGWFGQWNDFRSALRELLAKEGMEKILIILPDPGDAFFWQRRKDEIKRERKLSEDPIARLAKAIEMLYLALPANGHDVAEFLKGAGVTKLDGLSEFCVGFSAQVDGHIETYKTIESNRMLSDELESALKTDGDATRKKIKIMFVPGSMMGINIFDSRIIYVPYLPGVEDKSCPEFSVMAQTPLGASLERSISAMEDSGIEAVSRHHVMAMAFRLWRACEDHDARLHELSDVPAWLLDRYSALDTNAIIPAKPEATPSKESKQSI